MMMMEKKMMKKKKKKMMMMMIEQEADKDPVHTVAEQQQRAPTIRSIDRIGSIESKY
jgi:hypothetical protein